MVSIENYLKKNNLSVTNYGYNSVSHNLNECGSNLYEFITREKYDSVSFVTHSMGALVLRSMLNFSQKDSSFPKISRIVMIAPPNHGAEIADLCAGNKILNFLLGPNIQSMRTDTSSLANHLPIPIHSEIGIIAGYKNKVNGYNPLIKGDNDGYLTPERAKLGVEKDFVEVPASHAMIVHSNYVLKIVYSFLTTGYFGDTQPAMR